MPRTARVRLQAGKRRRAGSARWLARQLNDPYVQGARAAGYRSRAAYKLLQIDEKFDLLKRDRRVLDLGSAPGGWAQLAAARGCRVVGVDLEEVTPLDGVELVQGDVFDPATVARAMAVLGGPADVLLSDLAAPATGQRTIDRLRAERLAEEVLALLPEVLAPGGDLVLKLLRGIEGAIAAEVRRRFRSVRLVRPEATRRASSEIYLVALGRRGVDDGESGAAP